MRNKSFITIIISILLISSCNEKNIVNTITRSSLKGQVTDYITNEAVPNVLITTFPGSKTVLSDNDGKFSLDNISVGEYRLILEKNGFEPSTSVVIVSSDDAVEVSIPMKVSSDRNGMLYGYLQDSQNIPLDSVEVSVIDSENLSISVLTDKNGFYQVYIPNGIYRLVLNKPNYKPIDKQIQILRNQALNENFKLEKTIIDDPTAKEPNLFVYYSFDRDPAMPYAIDKSGCGHDGVIMNKNCSYEEGKFGLCIKLIGKAGDMGCWINMPFVIDLPEFTINFWVKEIDANYPAGQAYFQAGSNTQSVCLIARNSFYKIVSASHDLSYYFAVGATSIEGALNTPIEVSDLYYEPSKWNMFTITYKYTIMTAFINGKAVGIKSQAYSVNPVRLLGINIQWWSNDASTRLTACYDEFRIFDKALSDESIDKLYLENKY